MPVRDSRQYAGTDERPDIEKGVTILIPADRIMEEGRQAWRDEGFWDRIAPFHGSSTAAGEGPLDGVPFSQLDTDLAISLDIRDISLEKAGHNTLLPPHALVDAALLPVFALGALTTGGHLDLGARIFPSARMRLTAQVDLDAFSRAGDGLVLEKSYLVRLTDPAVSERELYPKFRATPEDGQAFGLSLAPDLAREAFRWIARDPELQFLPAFVRVAWLERVLAEPTVSADQKLILVEKAAQISEPVFSSEDLASLSDPNVIVPKKIMAALGPADEFAVNLEKARGRARLFESTTRVLINEAGRLDEKWRRVPLAPSEERLRARLDMILARWAEAETARTILIQIVRDDHAPWSRRRAALIILSRRLEQADSENFIQTELDRVTPKVREDGSVGLRAAAFMAAAQGPAMRVSIPRDTLFQGLFGDDQWAKPHVLFAVRQGDLGPEVVRLVGAMSLDEALPDLLRALESATRDPLEVDIRPQVALFAGGDQSTGILPVPDPIAITRALGGFAGNPDVVRALKKILEKWQNGVGVTDALCAGAIRSLGRVGDSSSVRLILKIWTRLAEEGRHDEVSQAALDALARLGTPDIWSDMLKTAESLVKGGAAAPGPQREVARFFGRIRYEPSVSYLGRLAEANAGNSAGNAAFQSLARLATVDAERILKNLSRNPEPIVAQAALAALETLARNQAMWRMLERS
jgi:hypothetical protein